MPLTSPPVEGDSSTYFVYSIDIAPIKISGAAGSTLAQALHITGQSMKRSLMPDFLQKNPLAKEIALAIVIKLVVIAALFYAFFDGRAVRTDDTSVAERLLHSQQQTPR